MGYRATLISLTCGEDEVRAWSGYMLGHMDEVRAALRQEGVRHEAWWLGHDGDRPCVTGVMDVDDGEASLAVSNASTLSVDEVHRRFKAHWDRAACRRLEIDPSRAPRFEGCELLFEARP